MLNYKNNSSFESYFIIFNGDIKNKKIRVQFSTNLRNFFSAIKLLNEFKNYRHYYRTCSFNFYDNYDQVTAYFFLFHLSFFLYKCKRTEK